MAMIPKVENWREIPGKRKEELKGGSLVKGELSEVGRKEKSPSSDLAQTKGV